MYSNKKKINVGFGILANEKTPNIDYKYGVYASKQEAFDYLGEDGLDVLAVGLTVGIMTENGVEEYWFKSACESVNDLVKKFNVRDPYQIWLDNGHEGTEVDFLDWLRSGNAEKIEELEGRMDAQEELNEQQQTQIEQNKSDNESQQEAIEANAQKNESQQTEIDALKTENESQQEEIETLKTENETQQSAIEEQQQTNEQQQTAIESNQTAIAEQQAKNEEQDEKLKDKDFDIATDKDVEDSFNEVMGN